MTDTLENLRYPVGRFVPPSTYSPNDRPERIAAIRELPDRLAEAIEGLDDVQLDTPYREGGWTVRQLVHHIADSHLNSFSRFKRTLSEEYPPIRGYDQDGWVNMPDTRLSPEVSLQMLRGIHARLTALLEGMGDEDFARKLNHNEWDRDLNLDDMLAMYAWHSQHHVAHITNLRKRNNW